MAEISEKQNLHIHLSGNKYLVSDNYNYWIVTESRRKNKKGEMTTYQTRQSGYHSDPSDAIESYYRNTIMNTELDGEIADFVKLMRKTKNEVKKWSSVFSTAYEKEVDG